MNKLNCKAVISADILVSEVHSNGDADFEIVRTNEIYLEEYLSQQSQCKKAVETFRGEIIKNAMDKVEWAKGQVYQYVAIVQFSDSCMCDTTNCQVVYTILEERM